jgi:glycerol-3-phosphate acyltransferase PlsY
MTGPWPYVIALPLAYLLGAIPMGLVVGRISRGIDVRRYGSGSAGATNVLRTMGVPAAVPVLMLDGAKGAMAVFIAQWVGGSVLVQALAAMLVTVGHSWPVFAGFKGGKSVITGLGAMFVLSPIAGLCALFGILVAAVTRYVSLGSVAGASAGFVCLLVLISLGHAPLEYLVFAIVTYTIIVFRHRENLLRISRGTENRLGMPSRPRRFKRRTNPSPEIS